MLVFVSYTLQKITRIYNRKQSRFKLTYFMRVTQTTVLKWSITRWLLGPLEHLTTCTCHTRPWITVVVSWFSGPRLPFRLASDTRPLHIAHSSVWGFVENLAYRKRTSTECKGSDLYKCRHRTYLGKYLSLRTRSSLSAYRRQELYYSIEYDYYVRFWITGNCKNK